MLTHGQQDAIQEAIDDDFSLSQRYHDAYKISHRILLLNLASIHLSSLVVMSTLQDLSSSDPALGTVDDLRKECERVFEEVNRRWTRDAISMLFLLDSALKQYMRVSSPSILSLSGDREREQERWD